MKNCFTILFILISLLTAKAQTIRYVKPIAAGTGDGTSWANASSNLQAMINASGVQQVWVAAGTYKPTTGTDRNISFNMKNGIAIYGGFPNDGSGTLVNRNPSIYETILSGNIGAQADSTDNSLHVISNTNLNNTAILDGFSIVGGYGADKGGGILNMNSSPIIRQCTFRYHLIVSDASSFGGAIYNDGGNPLIEFCKFSFNKAMIIESCPGCAFDPSGGALYSENGTLTINNCIFNKNTLVFSGQNIYPNGGAISINNGSANIKNSLFFDNRGSFYGGAIYNPSISTAVSIENCTFMRNEAYDRGASLYGNFIVKNSIFWRNNQSSNFEIFPNNSVISNSIVYGITNLSNGNKNTDPLFVDATSNNFQLQACSPAVNAGDNTGVSGVDLANNPRIYNSGVVDMGAYEFQGEAITAPTAVSISATTACQGTSVNLQATCSGGIITWYNASTGGTLLGTGSPFTYTPTVGANQTFYASCKGATCESALVASSNTLTVNNAPDRLYVSASATGANTGLSWTDAFTDLQSALKYTCKTNLTEIWVAKGTYKPHASDRNVSFVMLPNVKIYGGFPNTGNPTMTERNWTANPTILSGDLNGNDVVTGSGATLSITNNGENSLHVVFNNNNGLTTTNSLLDGFTIKGGNANGGSIDSIGGGMYNFYASPSLLNVVFMGNNASTNGGGMNNSFSSPSLVNVIFSSNNSGYQGGGMSNNSSNLSLSNVTFSGNNTPTQGGGMFNSNSSPNLNNVTFSSNNAGGGGGMFNVFSSPIIKNTIFWGNKTRGTVISSISNQEAAGYTTTITNSNIEQATGVYPGIGNINNNPLFVNDSNPAGADGVFGTNDDGLMLLACSPAVNVGDNVANTNTTDLAGNQRIFNTTIDMGAYETQSLPPARLYVNASATGANTGLSWADAFTDLQSALNYSCNTNLTEIWVAAGTYKPTTGTDRSISFSMKNGVAIYGGFAGAETQLSQRNWNANQTILSGDIGVVGVNTDNSYHVIYGGNTISSSTVLSGFVITSGYNEAFNSKFGGGVYLMGANGTCSPIFENCTFRNNTAGRGGAVGVVGNSSSSSVSPTFSNCLFYNNIANTNGSSSNGGALNGQANVTLNVKNCTFANNQTTGFGGAIYVAFNIGNPTLNLNNSVLWNNSAGFGGNEILSSLSTINISNSILNGGTAGIGGSPNIGTINNNGGVIDADPLFVNATNGDYSLQACSPAVNAGDNTGVSGVDLANNPRIYNSGVVDMGAYEFQGEAITAPTAVSISATTACQGTSVNLQATCSGGIITWYNASTGGTLLGTGSPFTYTPTVGANQTFYASCKGATCESALVASSNTLTVNNAPALLYVSASATGANTGLSWADAFTDLQSALNYPCKTNLTEIWVAKGTYKPTSGTNRDISFAMLPNVRMYGSFAGTETSLSERTAAVRAANPSILSGDIDGVPDVITGSGSTLSITGNDGNSKHVIFNNGATALTVSAMIDGFIITGGNDNSGGGVGSGGGMFNRTGSAQRIRNVTFIGNAASAGGALYSYESPLSLTNVFFVKNFATNGAAMYNHFRTSPTIINAVFVGNKTTANGTIYNLNQSSPTLNHVTFYDNYASFANGIFNNFNANPIITNSILSGPNLGNVNGSSPSITYSIVENGYGGTGNLNLDPQFVNPADPDGPDDIFGTADDGLIPIPCSPAVEAGDNITIAFPTDIAANPRVIGNILDMGAYEQQSTPGYTLPTATVSLSQDIAKPQFDLPLCQLIAKVQPSGASPVAGTVEAKVWIEPVPPFNLVPRHYQISPQANAETATGTITLYFTQADFDAYNQNNSTQLPNNPDDIFNIANIEIVQYQGSSADGSGLPDSYPSQQPKLILNSQLTISWEGNYWAVSFEVNGFSGFFAKTASQPLPLNLLLFTGKNTENGNLLSWKTANEKNFSHFEIERSNLNPEREISSQKFDKIGKQASNESGNYEFLDSTPPPGVGGQYRLRMVDLDGSHSFSKIIYIKNTNPEISYVAYPNPIKNSLTIKHNNAQLLGQPIAVFDVLGKKVDTIHLKTYNQTVDVSAWPSGTYFIIFAPNKTQKLIKK